MVLDASAVLAHLRDEPGAEIVEAALGGDAILGSVNLAEVLSKLVDVGADIDAAHVVLAALPVTVVDVDETVAVEIARLRARTRVAGLSLGDRACIALARLRGESVLTADRTWADLDLGIEVRMIR